MNLVRLLDIFWRSKDPLPFTEEGDHHAQSIEQRSTEVSWSAPLGLVLSPGHVDAAQPVPDDQWEHVKKEVAPGIYEGSVEFTDGVRTWTGRAKMRIFLNSSFHEKLHNN